MEILQRITFICLITHLKALLACTVCVFNSSYHVTLLPSDNIHYLPANHTVPERFTNKTTAQPYTSTHPLLVAWPCMHGSTEVRFPPPPPLPWHCRIAWHWLTHTHTDTQFLAASSNTIHLLRTLSPLHQSIEVTASNQTYICQLKQVVVVTGKRTLVGGIQFLYRRHAELLAQRHMHSIGGDSRAISLRSTYVCTALYSQHSEDAVRLKRKSTPLPLFYTISPVATFSLHLKRQRLVKSLNSTLLPSLRVSGCLSKLLKLQACCTSALCVPYTMLVQTDRAMYALHFSCNAT